MDIVFPFNILRWCRSIIVPPRPSINHSRSQIKHILDYQPRTADLYELHIVHNFCMKDYNEKTIFCPQKIAKCVLRGGGVFYVAPSPLFSEIEKGKKEEISFLYTYIMNRT